VLRRHPDIHHREIGTLSPHQFYELGGVAGLTDDLQAGAVQQAGQTLAQQDVVIGQDYPDAARIHMTIIDPDGPLAITTGSDNER
jgi:hypothetical protein